MYENITQTNQYLYMKRVADENLEMFCRDGFATPGHNGPHGHIDTPVRNTAHFLIIYSFLFKLSGEKKYLEISQIFAEYLITKQKDSKSGAIQCMITDQFDHMNGLIGQAWVIEALAYYYGISKDRRAIDTSLKVFFSQKYSFEEHLWHRIELNGDDIGIDPTYNHNIWFAAAASDLLEYVNDSQISSIIKDLLLNGTERDFRVYKSGLLKHAVLPAERRNVTVSLEVINNYCLNDYKFFRLYTPLTVEVIC